MNPRKRSYESTGSSEKISTQKRKKDALLLHSTDSKVDVFLLAAFPAAIAVGEEQRGFLLDCTLVQISGTGFDLSHYFFLLHFVQLFSVDTTIFLILFICFILTMKTWKNLPQKLLTIDPNFIFSVMPIGPNLAQISIPVP